MDSFVDVFVVIFAMSCHIISNEFHSTSWIVLGSTDRHDRRASGEDLLRRDSIEGENQNTGTTAELFKNGAYAVSRDADRNGGEYGGDDGDTDGRIRRISFIHGGFRDSIPQRTRSR